MYFIYPTLKEIFWYARPDPNNHLINTLLVRFMAGIFPIKDFTLRIPNVLGYIVYLLFTWQIARRSLGGWWPIVGFLFLNSIPYLLDFFSMARGYGLSFSLLAASLYYLKLWLEERRRKSLVLLLLTGFLAVLCSFVLVNYYLALCGVLVLNELILTGKSFFRKSIGTILLIALFSIPLLSYVLFISLKMKEAGQLYAGTDAGFWSGTVRSLITRLLYREEKVEGLTYLGGIFLIVCPIILSLIYSLKKPFKISFLSALSLILVLCAVSLILQFHLMQVLYILDRTALFLVIPFAVLILELFASVLWKYRWSKIGFGVIAAISLFNLATHANFHYFLETKYDADTHQAMKDLRAYVDKNSPHSLIRYYPYWVYEPVSAFYQSSENFGDMEQIERFNGLDFTYKYFYVPDTLLPYFGDRLIRVINRYPTAQSTLFENVTPDKKEVYAHRAISFSPNDSANHDLKVITGLLFEGRQAFKLDTQAFGPTLEFDITSLPHDRELQVEVSAAVWCRHKPGGDIAVSVNNKNDSMYVWAARHIGDLAGTGGQWNPVHFILYLPQLQPGMFRIKVYLWNTSREPLYFSDMKAVVTGRNGSAKAL